MAVVHKYKKVPLTAMKLSTILEAGFVNYTRDDADPSSDSDQNVMPDEESNLDDSEASTERKEDPDRQGSIRTVPNAHLVYKRKNENNLYTELWIYKQNQLDTWTMKTYDAIIAGSDIPKGSLTSSDGAQTVEKWEVGSPKDTLVFVCITGLSN